MQSHFYFFDFFFMGSDQYNRAPRLTKLIGCFIIILHESKTFSKNLILVEAFLKKVSMEITSYFSCFIVELIFEMTQLISLAPLHIDSQILFIKKIDEFDYRALIETNLKFSTILAKMWIYNFIPSNEVVTCILAYNKNLNWTTEVSNWPTMKFLGLISDDFFFISNRNFIEETWHWHEDICTVAFWDYYNFL